MLAGDLGNDRAGRERRRQNPPPIIVMPSAATFRTGQVTWLML
jgi:hypothetical protein